MARNRQRARERKDKDKLARDNVPGEWEHGSAEVDRVEAEMAAGADGRLADDGAGNGDSGLPPTTDDDAFGSDPVPAPAAKPERPEGNRVVNFLKACVAELKRVQWPDRRGVGQATAVVLGFVVLAGAFLGLADVVAQRIVDFLL